MRIPSSTAGVESYQARLEALRGTAAARREEEAEAVAGRRDGDEDVRQAAERSIGPDVNRIRAPTQSDAARYERLRRLDEEEQGAAREALSAYRSVQRNSLDDGAGGELVGIDIRV